MADDPTNPQTNNLGHVQKIQAYGDQRAMTGEAVRVHVILREASK